MQLVTSNLDDILPKKQNKLRNVPMKVDGQRFASKLEARRYVVLKLLLDTGKIRELVCQHRFRFACGASYVADFCYYRGSEFVVEDCKGVETALFRLKSCLMLHEYKIKIVIIRKS